jgi:hypothetical protein
MTTEALVVLGLAAPLGGLAAWLWRAERRRNIALKSASRALRLQEQLDWDRNFGKLGKTP